MREMTVATVSAVVSVSEIDGERYTELATVSASVSESEIETE
jgi:hypothetical protein